VEILRDRLLSAKTQTISSNPKNKKKKDKKKQKLQLKRQQILNEMRTPNLKESQTPPQSSRPQHPQSCHLSSLRRRKRSSRPIHLPRARAKKRLLRARAGSMKISARTSS
jgi:hypothetical protein